MTEKEIELEIPLEPVLEQRLITFEQDDLLAARAENGIYIAVHALCTAFSLETNGQIRRMKTTKNLSRGLRIMKLKGNRGLRDITCLHLKKVAIWLAGVETTRMKNQEMAEKIDRYQENLEDVATQVFFATFAPSSELAISTPIAQEYQESVALATILQEHLEMNLSPVNEQLTYANDQLAYAIQLLEQLVQQKHQQDATIAKIDERTSGLSPDHRYMIKRMVDRIIQLGSKLDPPLRYHQVYGPLIHRFRVTSYKDIRDEQYRDVETFLHDLQQSLFSELPNQGKLFE